MDPLVVAFLIVAGLLVFILLFWRFWFLRLPTRRTPANGIVSPADGKVVRIIPFSGDKVQDVPKGLLGRVRTLTADVAKSGYLIVIMLTPLDVHYQRAPADGVVRKVSYSKGRFANAVSGAAELGAIENEKNEILLETPAGKVKVVQVAGFLARRIRCDVKPKGKVKRGDVIGLINLGSQVLLVIPRKRLLVRAGDHVTDGETVIAR